MPLWRSEMSQETLTTAQSSIILGIFICTCGQDKLGTTFIEFGARLAWRIGVHTRNPECFAAVAHAPYDADQLSLAHKTVAYGIYDCYASVFHSLCSRAAPAPYRLLGLQVFSNRTYIHGYGRLPTLAAPAQITLSWEDAACADGGQLWTPYPFKLPVYRSARYAALRARSELALIVVDATIFAVGRAKLPLTVEAWETGRLLLNRLLEWKEGLPDCLCVAADPSPSVLCLQ